MVKKYLLVLMIALIVLPIVSATPFISTWDTTQAGTSNASQITLPITGSYTVDWGDTTSDSNTVLHNYSTSGIYTITINGSITGFRFNNGGDKLKILNVTQWGTDLRVGTTLGAYFYGCTNLKLDNVNDALTLTGTTSLASAFRGCTSLTTVNNMNSWDTSAVTTFNSMFYGASAFNQPVNSFNLSGITATTGLTSMFRDASSFNQNLTSWDIKTGSATSFSYMFKGASNFDSNISNWDTRDITNMEYMFAFAKNFNQDLNGWNVSKVTTLEDTFDSAYAFNQNLSGWDLRGCNGVGGMSATFWNAISFNQPLNTWNTSVVTNLVYLFYNATAFNQNLSNWDVSKVTGMGSIFQDATSFNGDITTWNTKANTGTGEYRENMFLNAASFNQDLSAWNVSNFQTMKSMFNNTALSASNYDSILNGWSSRAVRASVTLDAPQTRYCLGKDGRDILTNATNLWTINDAGYSCYSCIYSGSGNWLISLADNCSITSDVNVTPNNITLSALQGAGNFTIVWSAHIYYDNWFWLSANSTQKFNILASRRNLMITTV